MDSETVLKLNPLKKMNYVNVHSVLPKPKVLTLEFNKFNKFTNLTKFTKFRKFIEFVLVKKKNR